MPALGLTVKAVAGYVLASRIATRNLHRRPAHRARRLTAASQQEPQPGTFDSGRAGHSPGMAQGRQQNPYCVDWGPVHPAVAGRRPRERDPGEVAQGAPREAREVWASGGMAPLAALRSFAGKLSWAAGIYKRARWTVSMIYGAIAAHEAEVKTGLEEARRQTRKDNRPKEFMVPIKRFEMAQGLACHFAQGEAPENLHDVVEEARIHHDRHGCLPPGVRRPPVGEGDLSHVPGKINVLADWLSRPETRGEPPGQGGQDGQPKKLQRSDFSLGLNRSHDASEAGATWAAHKPSAHIADHGAHTAPRGRGPARAHRALRPMAFCVRLRGLDSMHLPSRSIVDRCATCHSGASPSSAAVADGCSVLTKPGTSRSYSRRSRTPARQQQCRSRPETREAPGRGLRQGHRERTEGAFPTGPPGFGTGPRPLRFFCCGSGGPSMGTGTREPPRQVDADRTVRRSFPRSGL